MMMELNFSSLQKEERKQERGERVKGVSQTARFQAKMFAFTGDRCLVNLQAV